MVNNATPELCSTLPSTQRVDDAGGRLLLHGVAGLQRQHSRFHVLGLQHCGPNNAKPTDCAAQPLLQAIVAFDDYPSGVAVPSPTATPCSPILQQGNPPSGPENGSCGVSMTQISWQWNPIVPAITSLSPASGTASGGTTVQINGTGFTTGETVNFTEQPQELPAANAYNPPVAGTVAAATPSCPAATCIQVTTPAITVGNAYFVTVTTPGGTSQTAPNDYTNFVPTFTYSPAAPTVSGLTGSNQGSITGNTLITIQGTGFWNAPRTRSLRRFSSVRPGPRRLG